MIRNIALSTAFAAVLTFGASIPSASAEGEPEVIKVATVAPKGTPWSALM
jgi:hypothetical protein